MTAASRAHSQQDRTWGVNPALWLHQVIMPNSTRIFAGGPSLPNQTRCSWSYDASMLLTTTVAVAAQQQAAQHLGDGQEREHHSNIRSYHAHMAACDA